MMSTLDETWSKFSERCNHKWDSEYGLIRIIANNRITISWSPYTILLPPFSSSHYHSIPSSPFPPCHPIRPHLCPLLLSSYLLSPNLLFLCPFLFPALLTTFSFHILLTVKIFALVGGMLSTDCPSSSSSVLSLLQVRRAESGSVAESFVYPVFLIPWWITLSHSCTTGRWSKLGLLTHHVRRIGYMLWFVITCHISSSARWYFHLCCCSRRRKSMK